MFAKYINPVRGHQVWGVRPSSPPPLPQKQAMADRLERRLARGAVPSGLFTHGREGTGANEKDVGTTYGRGAAWENAGRCICRHDDIRKTIRAHSTRAPRLRGHEAAGKGNG